MSLSVRYVRGKNVTLRLVWDHMPLTGTLFMKSSAAYPTTFPTQYS